MFVKLGETTSDERIQVCWRLTMIKKSEQILQDPDAYLVKKIFVPQNLDLFSKIGELVKSV